MNRYVIGFSKSGYIKYTSHLDLLRLFKRAFKKTGVALIHSQGFNPHPKMIFAQPLSLGYASDCELLEFETGEALEPEDIKERISNVMPVGITIDQCKKLAVQAKSLAAMVNEAQYQVNFPVKADEVDCSDSINQYLSQETIMAEKRQKKTKKMVPMNIKPKIRGMEIIEDENLSILLKLDSGSDSNLSPELVISTFMEFAGLNVNRYDVEVTRKQISFSDHLEI